MDDVIKRACAALGVDPARVLSSRIDSERGQVSIVVDNGIAGCPKLVMPLSAIPEPEQPKEERAKDKPKRAPRKRASKKKSS